VFELIIVGYIIPRFSAALSSCSSRTLHVRDGIGHNNL